MNRGEAEAFGRQLGRQIAETGDKEALRIIMRSVDHGKHFQSIKDALDQTIADAGIVEVEVLVGEEPEDGVELEVVPVDAWSAANCWEFGAERP